jgi:hypothetical protein
MASVQLLIPTATPQHIEALQAPEKKRRQTDLNTLSSAELSCVIDCLLLICFAASVGEAAGYTVKERVARADAFSIQSRAVADTIARSKFGKATRLYKTAGQTTGPSAIVSCHTLEWPSKGQYLDANWAKEEREEGLRRNLEVRVASEPAQS